MSEEIFKWDKNSDQPFIIKDKEYKKSMRKKYLGDYLYMVWINLFIFPIAILVSAFFKGKIKDNKNFFAMCVNLDKGEEQASLIEELDCKNISIRVPLSDIENIDSYVKFALNFKGCDILINILQDRENIEKKELFKKNIEKIFESFKGISTKFQIANAINRAKWGFFSVKEYMDFYKIAYDLRDEKFEKYELLGPSVIDFEYHYTIRALFNKSFIYFDRVSALLYVDRRGAPENKQMFSFDTSRKIELLYTLISLAKRSSNKLVITEVNWPISNTAPYAPTSENECVSERDYARFMLRYYLLCLGSKKVQSVYWHQLIASGYGLIDARGELRKRDAFYVYKTMLKFIQNSELIDYKKTGDLYILTLKNRKNRKFDIVWISSKREIPLEDAYEVYDMFGKKISGNIKITQSPIYAYHK